MNIKTQFLLLCFCLCTIAAFSQDRDSLFVTSEDILLTASRISTVNDSLPSSIYHIRKPLQIHQNNSLQEHLHLVPGLFAQNANNFAQDLRVSIRGFGARAAFGIRGIRLIVDGIPETTPDGQSQLDNLELNNIASIQVIRGLSSGLYGNASGGVIRINSPSKVDKNFTQANVTIGSYGTYQTGLKTGFKFNNNSLILNGRYFQSDGFRSHAESKLYSLSAAFNSYFNSNWKLRASMNFTDSPVANDPGALNLEDISQDRSQARQRNIDFDAGESITHTKAALRLQRISDANVFTSSVFYHNRKFDGKLPFNFGGIVDLNRSFVGNSSSFEQRKSVNEIQNKLVVGYDLHHQLDHRKRFLNIAGQKGDATLDQHERFTNIAVYLIDHLNYKDLLFNTELRFDVNRIQIENLLSPAAEDPEATYNSLNYGFGVTYKKMKTVLPYIKISSNLETPTLSELSADPQGTGFNDELAPNTSQSIELGCKGDYSKQLDWQAAVFYIQSSNEILPFELEEFPDRDFFINAGETSRIGLETNLRYNPSRDNFAAISYSYSDFKFKDYILNTIQLEDKSLPGIPNHNLAINLGFNILDRFSLYLDNNHVGRIFADNVNSVKVDAYMLTNVKFSTSFNTQQFQTMFYGGIQNMFNQMYFDNIRLNAFGARYYEAAPGRNFYLGLRLTL